MRIRYKKWARPELEASKFYVDNPEEFKGRWKEFFKNQESPFHIELGCGKGQFISKLAVSNKNINYLAIDLVDAMLGLAKRNIEAEYKANNSEIDNVCITRFDIERILLILDKKDNVERVDIEDKNRKVSTITDFESNQVTTWYPEEKTASVYNTELTAKIHLPLEEGINNQQTRAFMGLTSIIYSEECNSKQCYVIMQVCSPKMMNSSQKTWIDKETGLVVKREYLNSTIEYNNVELNNVRNIDTPDLRTYKVEKED